MSKRNQPCSCGSNIKYKKCCGSLQPSESALVFCNQGNSFIATNDFQKAIDCYRKALSISPLLVEAHYNLAYAYQGNKLLDDAMQTLLAAVEIFPENRRIADFLINILNNYMPDIETDSPYVTAQKALQQISKGSLSAGIIADETVLQLYKQCHDILTYHKVDVSTSTMQLYRGGYGYNNCSRHKKIFNKFNIIPEYCFDCYKVAIEPRTVLELIKLLLVFDKLELPENNHRKCFVEMRPEMSGRYKGLIYCRNLAAGKEILNIVQPILDTTISNGIPIYVKRGCSEFPIAYPEYGQLADNATPQMIYNEEWRKHEECVDEIYVNHDRNPNDFTLDHSGFTLLDALVVRNWLAFAEEKAFLVH